MNGDLDLLKEVQSVMPIGVALPNGKENIADKRGSVNLSEKVKLNNVLYAPNLHCKLIFG